MTLKETLCQARNTLTPCSNADARLEAELLMMDALGVGRTELYLNLEQPVSTTDEESFWRLVQRRLCHEPIAYILGTRQFYGIDFYIDWRALIPRPESELLVEETLKFASKRFSSETSRSNPFGEHTCHSESFFGRTKNLALLRANSTEESRDPSVAQGDLRVTAKQPPCSIADVGTGSCAIAIALALHLPGAKIYATDVSDAALAVARINCRKHGMTGQIQLLIGDMLQPLPEPVDIIVANLPYVRDSELSHLSPEIQMFEPRIALAGGADGLDNIRQLLPQAKRKLRPKGMILVEIGQGQGQDATILVKSNFPHAQIDLIPDLGGIDRVLRVVT